MSYPTTHQGLGYYLRQFKSELAGVAIFSLVSNLLMLTPTLYMLQLYDRVLISKNALSLYAITLISVALFMVMAFCEWMRSRVVIHAGVRFDQLLSSRVFSLGFAAAFSQRAQSHLAMQDLTYIRQFMTGNGLFAFFDLPWTLLYIAVLFVLHPMLGGVAIIFCLIQFGLAWWNQNSSEQVLAKLGEAQQQKQRFLDSKIRNIASLHVMGMVEHLYLRWQKMQSQQQQLDNSAIAIQSRNQLINKFVRYSMQSLILAAAALLAVQGKISIGAMIASNVLIARALQPFDIIVSTWKQYVQARQAASRLEQLLATEPTATPQLSRIMPTTGDIEVRGLSISIAQQTVLHNIHLQLGAGQITTVMGASGSGKSTLIRALARVCSSAQQTGEILYNGVALPAIEPADWAAQLGYLPQDLALLEGSIADNIARFQPAGADKASYASDVIAAAKAAGIHDSILRLPLGYDTQLSHSNPVLSGGQRQLLALARAIYQQPSLLLLDEPNSHLDEHGESHLINCLLNLKQQGKNIVLVSHRSSLLRITDQLLILHKGEIQHCGPRDAVIAAKQQATLAA